MFIPGSFPRSCLAPALLLPGLGADVDDDDANGRLRDERFPPYDSLAPASQHSTTHLPERWMTVTLIHRAPAANEAKSCTAHHQPAESAASVQHHMTINTPGPDEIIPHHSHSVPLPAEAVQYGIDSRVYNVLEGRP